jgi:hypothetical protein
MKISAILLVSIAVLGTTVTTVRAEEPEKNAQPEAVAIPYYTGLIVLPESSNDAPPLSDNLTTINVNGSVGYVDANGHLIGLSD